MAGKIRRYKHLVGTIKPAPIHVLMFSLGENTITYTSTDLSFIEMMTTFCRALRPTLKGSTVDRMTVPIR